MRKNGEGSIRFILIGLGHIGSRYARLIEENPNAQVLAACDLLPKPQANFPVYASLEELLQQTAGQADVAVIATPNGLHSTHGIACLKAGLHIICEKPMALSLEECDALEKTAQEQGREIFCVMQNRFSPAAAWLHEMVHSGKLGRILMVRTDCFWNRDERYYTPGSWRGTQELDGGTLFTQFSHFLDLLLWVFGDVQDIQGYFENFTHRDRIPFEDSGTLHFKWKQGGLGVLSYSTSVWDKNLESSITILGTKGSAQIAGQYMNEIRHCHVENYTQPALPPSAPANDYGGYQGSASNHHLVIENVLAVLRGESPKAVSVEEGRKVVDLITRIYAVRDLGLP